MSTINYYKIETDNTISCVQEKCSYKFRSPKNKQKSIVQHYYTSHKNLYSEIKKIIKPYSKTLEEIFLQSQQDISQQQTIQQNEEDQIYARGGEYRKKIERNIKDSFCIQYLVDGNYYNFKFFKVTNGFEMRLFLSIGVLKIIDNLLDDFSFLFISFHNSKVYEIVDDEYLFLNPDVKIAKIYYKKDLVFETNNFAALFD
ncbi:8820_t:CDS:1 [Cetraspora pellucida]|uniref:8820_t:CDS:1 n=1 Tax=Cetraspora pellucida TaxID=1433469 RepID=A0A9N8VAX8_9GLOM|nr:8820_t:CDS:1 [Cetraspora pellucida]